MKTCKDCGETKDVSFFPKTGRVCKKCKARKLRKYRRSDPEQKEKRRRYLEKNRDRIRQQKRNNYYKHANKIKKRHDEYYHQNAEKCKERQRRYQEKVETVNVESWLAKCMKHARFADKKHNRLFDLDLNFLLKLYNDQNGRCAISNVPLKHERRNLFSASIDRIDAHGGHTKDNVQLVCQAINLAKREYGNEHALDFLFAAYKEIGNVIIPEFDGFSFPESTSKYSSLKKKMVMNKLVELCSDGFVLPSYDEKVLKGDVNRIDQLILDDYLIDGQWRSYKPESKPFAGKRIIWHYQKHLWDVRVQDKPLIKEVWGKGDIFKKALVNLVNGSTRISFDRIVRELIFAGAGIPSQMHPGFAKAVLLYFGCKSNQILYDPFAGWGGRLLAAQSLGIRYHACEMSRLTHGGLVKMSIGDNVLKNIDCLDDDVPNADIMFTSPPFGTEEYIGADSFVNLDEVLEKTKHIPIRILHLNNYLADFVQPKKDVIFISVKKRASAENSKECLVIV